jgi:hypothetical protein
VAAKARVVATSPNGGWTVLWALICRGQYLSENTNLQRWHRFAEVHWFVEVALVCGDDIGLQMWLGFKRWRWFAAVALVYRGAATDMAALPSVGSGRWREETGAAERAH